MKNKFTGIFKTRLNEQNSNLFWLLIFMIIIFFAMGMIKPATFFSMANFQSMGFQLPEIAILSIGVMLPIITGGFDLSMVGVSNLSSVVAALYMINVIPPEAGPGQQALYVIVAFILAVIVGTLCGYLNGVIITRLGVPSMIVTLGGQYLFMGIAIILTEGKPQLGFPTFFQDIGNGTVGVIPIPTIIFIIVAVVMFYILHKTSYGTKLYLIGSNTLASRYSGINVDGLLRRTYSHAGTLAAIAGFILIARTNQANADFGTSYVLQSIMVAVLGGTNPNGGSGSVLGVVMAVMTMQFISTGMNMIGVSNVNFLRQLVWGVVLIVVVAIYYVSSQRNASRSK